ncbi:NYN domain-containing protein [Candidatus Dependentiae bacterium]|nr:NYN domain-containing protein [Candidatus Dependentiae bacterium]
MIIVIDGYNFLKSITGTKFIPESQMLDWINYFQKYIYYRGNQIIVALDAGPYLYESYQRYGAVEVWYAGQYQSADDWIKNWLNKNKQKDILLVSSDREIRSCANDLGLVSISSQEFYDILDTVLQEQEHKQEIQMQSLHKTKQDDVSDLYLDSLMEMNSRSMVSVHKENEYTQDIKRTSKNKKNSKSDRNFLKKINKI